MMTIIAFNTYCVPYRVEELYADWVFPKIHILHFTFEDTEAQKA